MLAWVIEKALSENQGYQQARASLYKEGSFGEVKSSEVARYYQENGKKKITSCAFGIFSDTKNPQLLEKRTENQACVTLACGGKTISQILIQGKNTQKTA